MEGRMDCANCGHETDEPFAHVTIDDQTFVMCDMHCLAEWGRKQSVQHDAELVEIQDLSTGESCGQEVVPGKPEPDQTIC